MHSSPVKVVSGALSKFASTKFSLTVYDDTGVVWVANPFVTCESSFGVLYVFASTQFSLTIYEYTGAVWVTNPFVTSESTFGGYF